MYKKRNYLTLVMAVCFLFFSAALVNAQSPGASSGNSITPVVMTGDPDALDIGYDSGFRINGAPNNGVFTFTPQHGELIGGAPHDPNKIIPISNCDGFNFDWSANTDIMAVIVKGGNMANVYHYKPGCKTDTKLHPPIDPKTGKCFDIKHIEFCFNWKKPAPSIKIEKATNGEDADVAPGPLVAEGSTVTWTYVVTNTGNVPLKNVVVHDDKIGQICTIDMLDVGESKQCEATGTAVVGQYKNLGSVFAWYKFIKVYDCDKSHYVGEKLTPVPPDDFAVCISFKDASGAYVGDVLCTLSIPGEKDWKVLSTPNEILAGGMWPCNAHFRRLAYNVGGTYRFKFVAPDGYRFTSPDHMEIEMTAGTGYYGVSGNVFYLEKTTSTNSDQSDQTDLPATWADNVVAPPGTPSNSLIFIKGSQTASDEGWDNLVDGDVEGWDGTTTMRADEQSDSPAFGIFRFADGNIYQFKHVKFLTDNGSDDNNYSYRQGMYVDLQVSTTGIQESDFSSVDVLRVQAGTRMNTYDLDQPVQAKYVRLVILPVSETPGGWNQLVEMALESSPKRRPTLAKSDGIEFSSLPDEYSLQQNYPNPFNPVTTIQYELPTDSHVKLTIFDISGRQIATLVDESQNAGSYNIQWDGSDSPSGLYFYSIQADDFKNVRKMTLVK